MGREERRRILKRTIKNLDILKAGILQEFIDTLETMTGDTSSGSIVLSEEGKRQLRPEVERLRKVKKDWEEEKGITE